MSKPTDAPAGAADLDPVQDLRAHFKQALTALDRLGEVLPPPCSSPPPDAGGGSA